MRALLVVLLVLGCKGKEHEPAAPAIDWKRCGTALGDSTLPLGGKPKAIIDACPVCGGDWTPLLRWNFEPANGGPRREQIEQIMVACNGFCTGDSKLKFMAAVDKARGKNVDTPWRQLAVACKDQVNGATDERFMSAPFFALDRIARAAAAKGFTLATLPLPAVAVGGIGPVLPEVDAVVSAGRFHITVLGDQITIGKLPVGEMTAHGITVTTDYPGEAVKLDELAEKLTALVAGDKTQPIMLIAPQGMAAQPLVPIIAAASTVAPVQLAARAHESPEGWQLVGAIHIGLNAGNEIDVTGEMTVQNLARELAARAARNETRVGVTKH
jgi:hypothetical protein